MKFCKLLTALNSESLAEEESPVVSYKRLKKMLGSIRRAEQREGDEEPTPREPGYNPEPTTSCDALTRQDGGAAPLQSPEEQAFVDTLNHDLDKINDWFIDREEESVIKLQVMDDRLRTASCKEEVEEARKAFVDFHGELVLLLHWSLLNYAAVAKILKKHDKVTGGTLKTPYLATVLHQPFCSTGAISRLAKVVEDKVKQLAQHEDEEGNSSGQQQQQALEEQGQEEERATAALVEESEPAAAALGADAAPAQLERAVAAAAEEGVARNSDGGAGVSHHHDHHLECQSNCLPTDAEVMMLRRTQAALGLWAELQQNAHTPSTVLPAAAPPPAKRQRTEHAV